MPHSTLEKRRHARLTIEVDYQLVIDQQIYSGKISDLSLSGTYLASSTPPLPISCLGRQGVLKIKTKEQWVSLSCEIIYIGTDDDERYPGGAGIAFSDNDENNSAVIWNLALHFMSEGSNLF